MSGEPEPKIVEAQQFVVRDANGKIGATLGVLNHWRTPELSLSDENGVPRIYIDMWDDGYPCLRFLRPDGNPLFSFGRTENGWPILGVSRGDATPALLVIAPNGEDVRVGLCKADGEPVWLHLDSLEQNSQAYDESAGKNPEKPTDDKAAQDESSKPS